MNIAQLKDDFMLEAVDLLDEAEAALLDMDTSASFKDCYNKLFRSFHSLKGASGMFGLELLQAHMHKLESLLDSADGSLSKSNIDYFLRGVDCAREYFVSDTIDFEYINSLADDDCTASVQAENKSQESRKKLISEKEKELIFVVDDEKVIVELLEELLVEAGYRVQTFLDGEDLLSEIEKKEPNLIVSDINMPKLDGLTMSKKLNELGHIVPIVFVSGYVTKEAILNGLESNASFFLEKPFNEKSLLTIVGSVLRTSRVKTALAHSMDYILYQFANHEELLRSAGKEKELNIMKDEILHLLQLSKSL